MAPLTIVVLAAFFAAISALSSPESALAHVLSFVPPTAPLVLLVRTVEGTVGAAELVAALAVMALGIVVTARIAGRIYAGAIPGHRPTAAPAPGLALGGRGAAARPGLRPGPAQPRAASPSRSRAMTIRWIWLVPS